MNRNINWLLALVLVLVPITTMAKTVDQETEAVTAAEGWLALVDAGKYDESWKAA
jgi:hypothetical protein